MGDFSVNVYTVNSYSNFVTTWTMPTPSGAQSQVTFNLNPYIQDYSVVSIVRLDAEEEYLDNKDYKVEVTSGVTVNVEPFCPPVIIGANGGTIQYSITVANQSNQWVYTDVWCNITLPDGSFQEQVYQYLSLYLAPNSLWQQDLTYEIPSGYTSGNYLLYGFVGDLDAENSKKWDLDYFNFTVVGSNGAPEIDWTGAYGSSNHDFGYDAFERSENQIDAVGSYNNNDSQAYWLETDANGNQINHLYSSSGVVFYSIDAFTGSGYIAAGTTPDNVVVRIVYDEYGHSWTSFFGAGYGPETGYDAQQTSDLGFIVTGVSESYTGGLRKLLLIKEDVVYHVPYFIPGWTRTYDNGGNEASGHAVLQSIDGNFVATGWTLVGDNMDVYVIKVDEDGDPIWDHQYHNELDQQDFGDDMRQTSDGGFVIAGTAGWDFSGTSGMYVIKTDEQGNVLWDNTYRTETATCLGRGVWQCADGGFIVVGFADYAGPDESVYIIRLSGSGNEIWSMLINGEIDNSSWRGESIRQLADGGYIICGGVKKAPEDDWDLLLIRLHPETWVNTIFGLPPEYEVLSNTLPKTFVLEQNYPNPFNPSTVIRYQIPDASLVSLRVYDTAGRLVSTLVNGNREAGEHQVSFDGSTLSSGVYLYQLEAGEYTASGKMVLLK